MATNCLSDDDNRVDHKRMVHNEVERRRKVKINNWIYRLGNLLPGCSDDKKISKNGILERAVDYLKELQENNEKLLRGKYSEVQDAEFQRMKERIRELELRNSELTQIIECSGVTVDLETIWQQRGKYSHKIEPTSVVVTDSHGNCALTATTTEKKDKQLILNKVNQCYKDCVSTTVSNVSSSDRIIVLQREIPSLCSNTKDYVKTVIEDFPQNISTNFSSQDLVTTPVLAGNTTTAVTQALPSLPIMSTTQHTSGNQQLLQQLPVLNYGNTVNIFPGLTGQGQPMIIINEQGVPLFQNVIPGQVLVHPITGQSTIYPGNNTNTQALLQNKNVTPLTSANEINTTHANPVFLNAVVNPSPSGMPPGIASGPIIVNTGLGQSIISNSSSGQGQVIVNTSSPQSFLTCGNKVSTLVNNNQIIFASNANAMNGDTSNSTTCTLNNNAPRQFIQMAPSVGAQNQFIVANGPVTNKNPLPTSNYSTLNCHAPNQVGLTSVGNPPVNAGSVPFPQNPQTTFIKTNNKSLSESHITLSHEQTLLPVINNAVVNQMPHVSPQQNSVQILARESCTAGTMASNNASLPSALLLPNGQIIPVVSQPLLYPGNTAVNGSLIMTTNPQTTTHVTSGNITQSHPQIHTFLANDSLNQSKLTLQEPVTTSTEGSNINVSSYSSSAVSSVILTSQNESKPIQTTPDPSSLKKNSRKCHRIIKPKPATNNTTIIPNSEQSNQVSTEKIEPNPKISTDSSRTKSTTSKSSPDLTYLLNPTSTNSSSSTLSIGKSTDAATDILAKATESIFSTSVSETSPSVSNFYVCENGENAESNSIQSEILNRNESEMRIENTDKENQSEEYFGENHVENNSTTSNDILHDLVTTVYNSNDKDMPLLQPVSPVTSLDSNSTAEKNISNEKSNEILHAPKLSLMISDGNTNDNALTAKRSQTSEPQEISNKRQKSEQIKSVNNIPKDFTDELVTSSTTTASVNFLSITQLASSSFSMEGTLATDNSPLESISPLLESPSSKGISSNSFMTTSSTHSSSATPTTDSTISNMQNIVNNSDRGNLISYQENSLTQRNHLCNQNLLDIKSSDKLPEQCSPKIPSTSLFSGEPAVTSSGNLISSVVTTNESEMCTVKNSPVTYPSSQSIYGANKNVISCSSSVSTNVSHSDSSNLPHESYLHHFPPNTLGLQRQSNSNPLTSQQNNMGTNFITGNNSVTCSSLTTVTYSTAPTLAESCNSGFPENSRPSLLEPVISSSNSHRAAITTNTSYSNTANITLNNQSFNIPDLLQNNVNGTAESLHFNALRSNTANSQESRNHCLGSLLDLPNDTTPLNVPSFNIGLSTQTSNPTTPHEGRNSVQMSMQTPTSYSQNFFSQMIGLGRRLPGPVVNGVEGNKNKSMLRRRGNIENALPPSNVPPISATTGRMANHTTLNVDLQQPSSHTESSSVFPTHRSTAATISYSAEALISQSMFNPSTKQLGLQITSRPSLSYSAESLIQPPTDQRSHCSQNAQIHHQGSGATNALSSSYSNNNSANLQPTFSCFLQPPSKTTNNIHSSTLTHFSSPVHNKNSCTHQQQHGEVSFSFILSQPEISQTTTTQMQTSPIYSNMLNYGTAPGPTVQNSKPPVEMQAPMLPQGDECAANRNHQQGHACPNLNFPTLSSVNSFSNPFSSEVVRTEPGNMTDNLTDITKVPPDKTKPKDNQTNKISHSKSTKQTSQAKKKTLEEINLSNSIFETNRSVTPYFTIPNLSPPRNEAPTYLPNSNIFGVSQRPVGSNMQQNKCDVTRGPFNPLFSSRTQSGLNLNFPAPGFTVNHIHNNTSAVSTQISNHSNVPNFNLSNIFPDINNAGENNVAPIKFHPGNPIMSTETQHHQPSAPLYNRPVLHNGMSINSLLAHNPHSFDGRPPVPMPINNTMPVTFHSHAHTPSFNNVIPTLNFSMHEH